jgi:ribosomal protein S18 acetylase RimI-like enzyme
MSPFRRSPTAVITDYACLVRTMIPRDRWSILAINERWKSRRGREQLVKDIESPRTLGLTAVRGSEVLGFALFHLVDEAIDLDWIAVLPDREVIRHGVGRRLIDELAKKCGEHGKPQLTTIVPEDNSLAIWFLRSCEFHATRVICDHFPPVPGHGEIRDGYRFVLDVAAWAVARANRPEMAP